MKGKLRDVLVMFFLVSVLAGVVFINSADAALSTNNVFVKNLGQWDNKATFHMLIGETKTEPRYRLEALADKSGYVYHLSDLSPITNHLKEASKTKVKAGIHNIPQHAVSVSFVGGQKATMEARKPGAGTFNWLVGTDKSHHVTGAKAYRQVVYRNIYPCIDVTFDADPDAGVMETTYTVAPGGNPEAIVLNYKGADSVRLDPKGNLILTTSLGNITEMKPIAFQKNCFGKHQPVPVAFALNGKNLTFKVDSYDKNRLLYIDPVVVYSRTFGGGGIEGVSSMHEDSSGRYLTGVTGSNNFPTTTGAYQELFAGTNDLFAAKFDTSNATLLWATYIGSTGSDNGGNSALAPDGSLYLVASTANAATSPPNPPTYLYGPGERDLI